MSARRFPSFGLIREVVLIGGLGVLFVLGTQAAAVRQPLARHELDVVGYAILVLAAGALAWRTRHPRGALTVTLVLVGAYVLVGYPYGPVFLAVSVAVFAVVARSSTREASWVVLIALVGLLVPQLPGVDPANPVGDTAILLAECVWLVLVPALLAMIGQWSRQTRAAEQRQRVSEERLALAREVHDVIAHNLSMVSIQAGAALRVFDRDPEQARQALRLIHRSNQQSLADLRRTLDVLRRPEHERDGTPPPAPGLAQLSGLIEAVRASGLEATLLVEGTPVPVPALIELAAFRIVQESLTNVVRHAHATTATVRVRYGGDELTIEISDDGRGRADPDSGLTVGTGITGMKERTAAAGGRLVCGPAPGGGFGVSVRLPVGGAAVASR